MNELLPTPEDREILSSLSSATRRLYYFADGDDAEHMLAMAGITEDGEDWHELFELWILGE